MTTTVISASGATTVSNLVDEGSRRRFEQAWSDGHPLAIETFLPPESSTLYRGTLLELVLIEMEFQHKAVSKGHAPATTHVEGYVARFPVLASPDLLTPLVRHEFDVRKSAGESPDYEEYRRRFPDLIREASDLDEPTGGSMAAGAPLPDFPGYQVQGIIGHGGMGLVYRARQLSLKRDVALKILSAGPLAQPDELARFRAEAEAVARLQHPNIVQIFEVGEQAGRPYLVLELVEGGSLAQKLGGNPVAPRQAAQWTETLAHTVYRLHQQGILHRDLKPANILLTGDGVLKIADFGLAKRIGEMATHTQTGAVLGTPSYASPEQAAGKLRSVGPLSDVYALGAILYEMLTGRPPFRAESSVDTILQVLKDEPVPISRLQRKVPRDLETICHKCLQKEPTKRYESALALADDLHRFLAGEPIRARPIGALGRAWRWSRRNPALASAFVLSFALLLAVAVVSSALAVYHAHSARLIAQKEQQTEAALADARKERREAMEASAGMVLEEGINSALQGDVRAGLLWMSRAAQIAPESADLSWATRVQIGAWSREVNSLSLPPIHHDSSIVSACFSHDGKLLATGCEDGTARIWSALTGNPLARPMHHKGAVRFVAFAADDQLLLTAGADSARLWRTDSGQQISLAMTPNGAITIARFSPDGKTIIAGSDAGSIQVWSAKDAASVGTPMDTGGAVQCVAFSPDGRFLTAGSRDEVRIWQLDSPAAARIIKQPMPVFSVDFCSDCKSIAVAGGVGGSGQVRFWNVISGAEIGAPLVHPDRVTQAVFRPDGMQLATACDDGAARLWEFPSGKPIDPVLRHRENFPIRCVCYSHDGRLVASACSDGSVRLWDSASGRPWCNSLSRTLAENVVAFSPDDLHLLGGGDDRTAEVWSIAPGQSAQPPKEIAAADLPLAVSADGSLRVVINTDGSPVVTGQSEKGLTLLRQEGVTPYEREILCAAISPDGTRVVTGGRNKTAQLYRVSDGEPIGSPLTHPDTVLSVAWSPDGKTIATGCEDKFLRFWDAAAGQPVLKPILQRGPVHSLAFSSDSRRVIAGCSYLQDGVKRGQARCWLVASGAAVGQALRHQGTVISVGFSADGHITVTGSADRTARFWEAATGRPIGPPLEHKAPVVSFHFASDGQTLTTICLQRPPSFSGLLAMEQAWHVPQDASRNNPQLTTWVEVLTGLELDPTNIVHRVDDDAWQARRQQISNRPRLD